MQTINTQFNIKPWLFVAGCIYYSIWILLNTSVPFSFDYVHLVSYVAQHIYQSDFHSFITATEVDTGHPPLIPLLHAIIWKVFGKSLAASHWLMLPFACMAYYYFLQISSLWLKHNTLYVAALLFLIFPVTLAQIIYMSPDIALTAFTLGAIHYWLRKKYLLYYIMLSFILLTSVRGLPLFAAFFSAGIFLRIKEKRIISLRLILLYIVAALPCILWNVYHFKQTGWILGSSNTIWSAHRAFISINHLPIHIAAFVFRLLEFGGICIWIIVLAMRNNISASNALQSIYVLLMFTFIFYGLAILPFTNPISTRYLLPLFLMGLLIFGNFITTLSKKKSIQVLLIIILIMTGSVFYIYPDRFIKAAGYSWDCNVISLPYFKTLEKEAQQFLNITLQNDSAKIIYAGMPFYQSTEYTYLKETNTNKAQAWESIEMPVGDYFIESNIMNNITWEQKTYLEKNWKLNRKFQSGRLYINIYRNPHLPK
ncbi:MAG: hypothetical protein IPG60_12665 [Bacteroidetes bacterium]|nr:hypothetical protein [Bacteroidota bacterium]